jgi:hypothetical protein
VTAAQQHSSWDDLFTRARCLHCHLCTITVSNWVIRLPCKTPLLPQYVRPCLLSPLTPLPPAPSPPPHLQAQLHAVDELAPIAKELDCTLAQVWRGCCVLLDMALNVGWPTSICALFVHKPW